MCAVDEGDDDHDKYVDYEDVDDHDQYVDDVDVDNHDWLRWGMYGRDVNNFHQFIIQSPLEMVIHHLSPTLSL